MPMASFLFAVLGWSFTAALFYGLWYALGQIAKDMGTGRLQVLGGFFLLGKLF